MRLGYYPAAFPTPAMGKQVTKVMTTQRWRRAVQYYHMLTGLWYWLKSIRLKSLAQSYSKDWFSVLEREYNLSSSVEALVSNMYILLKKISQGERVAYSRTTTVFNSP